MDKFTISGIGIIIICILILQYQVYIMKQKFYDDIMGLKNTNNKLMNRIDKNFNDRVGDIMGLKETDNKLTNSIDNNFIKLGDDTMKLEKTDNKLMNSIDNNFINLHLNLIDSPLHTLWFSMNSESEKYSIDKIKINTTSDINLKGKINIDFDGFKINNIDKHNSLVKLIKDMKNLNGVFEEYRNTKYDKSKSNEIVSENEQRLNIINVLDFDICNQRSLNISDISQIPVGIVFLLIPPNIDVNINISKTDNQNVTILIPFEKDKILCN